MEAPDIIVKNEKRMLQEAVDALIDNGKRGRAVVGTNNRALKSLSDIIEGKQGRFRQNLLGKRVDYSGRSVIVVGPHLKINQCGLPKEMAIELFKPFVMHKLVERGIVQNIKSAKKKIESQDKIIWDVLEDVIKGHPILLNRAPTLHRLGIQAFEPILVDGKAIHLHPLVCTAYNADFDGDQMAVHVPLSVEAQTEAKLLMLANNNVLLPATGKPIITPSKDMVLGCYYLTVENPNSRDIRNKPFVSTDEVINHYQAELLHPHDKIRLRIDINWLNSNEIVYKSASLECEAIKLSDLLAQNYNKNYVYIDTTVGRVLLNLELPKSFKFINKIVDKKGLEDIILQSFNDNGSIKTSELADRLKDIGFHHATLAGISIAVDDLYVPEIKKQIVKKAEKEIEKSEKLYKRGEISAVERYAKIIDTWFQATEEITNEIKENYDKLNSVYMMAFSGARGNISQVRQLIGMRGLMADPSGKTIDLPIKSNFKEGLTVTEYMISSYGARKGIVDTALRTSDSGYLTRRLADVAQDVIVTTEDCGTDKGIFLKDIIDGDKVVVKLSQRLTGRTLAEDLYNKYTGEIVISKHSQIEQNKVKFIMDNCITKTELDKIFILSDSNFTIDDIKNISNYLKENVYSEENIEELLQEHKEILYKKYSNISKENLSEIINILFTELTSVKVRSPLTCQNKHGICRRCFGLSLTSKRIIDLGEPVGIIAAQSIGEPGTQLTMRTFHTGGVFEGSQRLKIKSKDNGTVKFNQKELESILKEYRTPYGEITNITTSEFHLKIVGKGNKTQKIVIPIGCEIKVKNGQNVKAGTIIAEQLEQTNAINKSVEKAYKEINSSISGIIKFDNFKVEEKKDKQGLIARISNTKGVIWVHSGNVYSLPSDCNLLIENGQELVKNQSVARISTTTEYGGKVKILGYNKKENKWDSISIVIAELSLPEPEIILDRKDIQLKFPESFEVNSFQLLVHDNARVESSSIIAESFIDKYVTPVSGEIRYVDVQIVDKNTVVGKSKILFLPEENYQLSSTTNHLLEESCMVDANEEIIPGIKVKESGFVSLENLELSQTITFYPDAHGVFFPIENAVVNVVENQEIKKGELLGQLIDPETQESQPIYSEKDGIVQIINSDEGMYIVVRKVMTYDIEPVSKFYTLNTSHDAIDLLPVTKLTVKNGDHVKAGTSLVKVNLLFKLNSPLTSLGGKIEFKVIEKDKNDNPTRAKFYISVVENLSTNLDASSYGLMGYNELKITSTLQVKDSDYVKPGSIIAYTDFMIQNPGKAEILKDSETGSQKLLIVNADNLIKIKHEGDLGIQEGQYLYEGDKLGKTVLNESAFVQNITKNEIVLRKARPYLVNAGSQVLVDDGDMVQQGETLAILVYEQVKTGDIIQGLPRVESLLEARKQKDSAILSQYDGVIQLIYSEDEVSSINVITDDGQIHNYKLPINSRVIVSDGQRIKKGDKLISGSVDPHDVLDILGIEAVQQFLVDEVQLVYRSQGVEINDRHIEIIVRQMTRKKKVEEPGNTTFLPGEIIPAYEYEEAVRKAEEKGEKPPIVKDVLLSITKAASTSESFISAASFQETTKNLTEAAIENKKDYLRGLKENVIIGRLIPAGVGMKEIQKASKQLEESVEIIG